MENKVSVDNLIQRIADAQLVVDEKKAELRKKYPGYEAEQAEIIELEEEIDRAKKEVTKCLSSNSDFDVHRVAGYAVSVTRIVKLEVENPEEVPDDLKEMKTELVVDVKRAQDQVKVLGGNLPGFKDKSHYRLNFKKVKNA